MMQLTEIAASTLDENTWYPVTITAGARPCMRAEVLVALDSGTKPSLSLIHIFIISISLLTI